MKSEDTQEKDLYYSNQQQIENSWHQSVNLEKLIEKVLNQRMHFRDLEATVRCPVHHLSAFVWPLFNLYFLFIYFLYLLCLSHVSTKRISAQNQIIKCLDVCGKNAVNPFVPQICLSSSVMVQCNYQRMDEADLTHKVAVCVVYTITKLNTFISNKLQDHELLFHGKLIQYWHRFVAISRHRVTRMLS